MTKISFVEISGEKSDAICKLKGCVQIKRFIQRYIATRISAQWNVLRLDNLFVGNM